jgi:diguanylate cyclase (GGDEF)-like protein
MALANINIFIIISILIAALSFPLGIYFALSRGNNKSYLIFAYFSFTTTLISFSSFVILATNEYNISLFWSHIYVFGILLFPVFLFNFIINYLESNLSRINKYIKLSFYVPSIIIAVIIFTTKSIETMDSKFGYIAVIPKFTILITFFLIPIYLAIISVISFELYKNVKSRKSITYNLILLLGIVLFTICNFAYYPLAKYGSFYEFPIYQALLFFLYIFYATSIINFKINTASVINRKILNNIEDGLLIADNHGTILEINNTVHKILFKKAKNPKKDKINDGAIKALLTNKFINKKKAKNLILNLEKNSIRKYNRDFKLEIDGIKKTYKFIISPILNSSKHLFGKVAILRDVTDSRILDKKLINQSERDFLTNLYNKRNFHSKLNSEIQKFNRYKETFSLLVINIDNFKKYKDKHGKLEGDNLLKEAASIFKENIRLGTDFIVRYSDHEFISVLPITTTAAASIMSQRILDQYNDLDIEGTSLSIGIGYYQFGMNSTDIIKNARSAMRKARKRGGSQVNICSSV